MKNYLRPHAHWRNKGQFHRLRPGIEPEAKVNQVQSNRITKTCRKVGAYDKDNNLIQEFDSLQLAAQFCGGNSSTISAVCRGKRNSHKNYIWRYLD